MARCPSQNCAVVLSHLLKHSQCFNPGFSTCVARTYARCRASGRVDSGHAARVTLGFRASCRRCVYRMARRRSHRGGATGQPPYEPSGDRRQPAHVS